MRIESYSNNVIHAETATYISAEGLRALIEMGIIEIDEDGNKHVREVVNNE